MHKKRKVMWLIIYIEYLAGSVSKSDAKKCALMHFKVKDAKVKIP